MKNRAFRALPYRLVFVGVAWSPGVLFCLPDFVRLVELSLRKHVGSGGSFAHSLPNALAGSLHGFASESSGNG